MQGARDLRWTIESPSLADPGRPDVTSPTWPPDTGIREDGLSSWLAARSTHRVGRYFEDLIAFYLTEIRGARLIAHGRQVLEEGKTLGEIDFLFDEPSGERVHWEVAVKFYLQAEGAHPGGSRLIGPNASDTWERKAERLFGSQLALGPAVDPSITRSEALVKGRICHHVHEFAEPLEAEYLSSRCSRGMWLRFGELEKWLEEDSSESGYTILEKPHWLGPPVDSSRYSGSTTFFDQVMDRTAESNRPIAFHRAAAEAGTSFGFLVPDDWPFT